jgi:broad specificity phosphatase PhoE
MDAAVRAAELAASELGVRLVVADGLQELSVGEPAENGHAVVERFKDAAAEIADTHRGETVLVFTHRSVMSLAIPRLSVNVRNDHAAQRLLPDCAPVEVEVDADGWRVISWPGVPDTSPASGPSSPGGAQNRREPTSSMPLSAS